ncbi:hypothetical protein JXB22_10830 [candidate division WOR-3 bacterium]|nr:hypothetical protein [candidate division WOR-3 bacterium]
MKTIIVTLVLLVGIGFATDMAPYCCAPPFVTTVVAPNILISLDNSGSMWDPAYSTSTIYMTDTTTWYGYFKPESMYTWSSNHWESDPAGIWPGNILNWATMSRADVAKKVLTGGKANIVGGHARLVGEGRSDWYRYYRRDASNYNRFYVYHSADKTYVTVDTYGANPPINGTMSGLAIAVDIPEEEYGGVLDQIGDKDGDEHWDGDAPIFGLWHYNTDRGGHIRDYLGDPDFIDLRNHINDMQALTWTPLAENYFEILHYFSQASPYYFNGDYTRNPQGLHDPYYDKYLHDMVECRRSFVLMITDGEATMDAEIPVNDATMPNCTGLTTYWNGGGAEHMLDDVCLYGHVNDLRPDTGSGWGNRELPDDQSIAGFIIYAFGTSGSALLREAGKCAGFKDKNGNHIPDLQQEWDENGDSIPDNYYEATNGYELEAAIMNAIMQMLERISSSSGVGVVSQGSKAGGATAQSQFYPRRTFPFSGEVLTWIGTCQSLWLDSYGWLREDTDQNGTLHLINDYVITEEFNSAAGTGSGNVICIRKQDPTGQGDPAQFVLIDTVEIEDLKPIWDGGKWLYNHTPGVRNITAFIDFDGNGTVNPGSEILNFVPANAAQFRPYMGVPSIDKADTIIQYIRGTDFTDLRPRKVGMTTWKLGDIINSSAVIVQSDIERYDFIYGDQSYLDYHEMYADRRQVVYVGGNDGMLHCFNGGVPEMLYGNEIEPMRYNGAGYDLGQELWAYIPYNLLPHLMWLPEPSYCHVYYNDLKVYVTDAQIFADDATHPHGWGTLLVGGMRLGGLPITNDVDTRTSALFAIDVTDPLDPVPMWEFTRSQLKLTTCYSSVVKVDSSWYLVFGSGCATCSGESNQNAVVYVLDLATGDSLTSWVVPEANSFITNIFGADWGLDYTVDRIYLGTCHEDGSLPGDYGGKIYRIDTNDDQDPGSWSGLIEVFDLQRPITGEGSIATDDYNHLWVYFGSGRFFSDADEADMTYQRYVGFRDDTTHAGTVAGLYDVTNVWIDTTGEVHGAAGITDFSALIDTVDSYLGWWREFDEEGERVIATTLVFGGAVLYTTFVPTGDICSYGGEGNLWALYYRTGTAYTNPFLIPDTTSERHPEKIYLGPGMPSEPSLYVSADQTKVFIQAGGGIVSPQTGIPGLPKSGVIIWKGR